jgi:hypothetical protein
MPTSQNGWPASGDRAAIGVTNAFTVAGVTFPGGVKAGDVAAVLGYVAGEFHRRVEQLVDGWCWGYAYRDVRGTTGLSNHASGTAIDVNAPNHPLGVRGTFTPTQAAEIRRIVAEVGGVVRWGGDYAGRVDEMHFEINANAAAVQAAAARMEDDMAGEAAEILTLLNEIKSMMWANHTGVRGTVADGTLVDNVRDMRKMLWSGGPVEGAVTDGTVIDVVRDMKVALERVEEMLSARGEHSG